MALGTTGDLKRLIERPRGRARCSILSRHFTDRVSGTRVDEYETLLTDNRIWKQRTVNIGVVELSALCNSALRGPCCSGSGDCLGFAQKTALCSVYGSKSILTFRWARNGDCYDRYLVRVEELQTIQPDRPASASAMASVIIPDPVMHG